MEEGSEKLETTAGCFEALKPNGYRSHPMERQGMSEPHHPEQI